MQILSLENFNAYTIYTCIITYLCLYEYKSQSICDIMNVSQGVFSNAIRFIILLLFKSQSVRLVLSTKWLGNCFNFFHFFFFFLIHFHSLRCTPIVKLKKKIDTIAIFYALYVILI